MGWKEFFFGGDNVKPNWAKERTRSNGKKDVIYGSKGSKSHGHSVRSKDGSIVYSRTPGGNINVNK